MTRIFFAVIAALLVSAGEQEEAPPAPSAQLTQVQLATAPSNVAALTQAEAASASVIEPMRACGCSSAPAPLDVLVLLGLLVMRTLSERVVSYRE